METLLLLFTSYSWPWSFTTEFASTVEPVLSTTLTREVLPWLFWASADLIFLARIESFAAGTNKTEENLVSSLFKLVLLLYHREQN